MLNLLDTEVENWHPAVTEPRAVAPDMRVIFRSASGCRWFYQMLNLLDTEVEIGIRRYRARFCN